MTLKKSLNGYCETIEPIRALVITGPTASGKTAVSLEIAKAVNGEILSCDSMQVYRHMDIGTAKATAEEQSQVPHHLIDIVEPWEEFCVADYCEAAKAAAYQVASAGKLPIFVGGTGLYVTSLIEGYSYKETASSDPALSEELRRTAATQEGVDSLYAYLAEKDPLAAEKIHRNNTKRLLRAVELYRLTGQTQQERNRASKQAGSFLRAQVFAVETERQALCERINRRVDQMMEDGLIEEVREVTELCRLHGQTLSRTAAQAIGYKETLAYLRGEMGREELAEAIKKATRKYAKRQMTWLRKWPWVKWIQQQKKTDMVSAILSHLSENADYLSENN